MYYVCLFVRVVHFFCRSSHLHVAQRAVASLGDMFVEISCLSSLIFPVTVDIINETLAANEVVIEHILAITPLQSLLNFRLDRVLW
jgi:hypothetical protein